MRVVYRAKSLTDARDASGVLEAIGIPTHVADQALWDVASPRPDASMIRVLVDNGRWDAARRALQAWAPARPASHVQTEA